MISVKVFWIILITISIISISKMFREKGWTVKSFIRIEDVEDDEKR